MIQESSELELKGKGKFDVMNGGLFSPNAISSSEGKVLRVESGMANQNGDTAHPAPRGDSFTTVDELDDPPVPAVVGVIVSLLENSQCQVENIRRRVVPMPLTVLHEINPRQHNARASAHTIQRLREEIRKVVYMGRVN